MAVRQVDVYTDFGADLASKENLKAKYGVGPIVQIPLRVTFGDKDYTTGVDIDNDQFGKLIHETGLVPKTAAISHAVISDIYSESIEKGLKILSIHMGDSLSATGQHARMATRKLEEGQVKIFNSGTVSMAEGFMAIKAEQLAAQGMDLDEIVRILDNMKERTDLRVITPNMDFIKKSGRVPELQTKIASIFDIVPVLQIDNDKVENVAKPISMRRALDWMANFARKNMPLEQVAIVEFEAKHNADILESKLIEIAQVSNTVIHRETLGPITGSHGGPGTLAMVIVRAR